MTEAPAMSFVGRLLRRWLPLWVGACLVLACRPVLAQSVAGAPVEDPEATLLTELVVTAKAPGPAWWTVEKGQARLYILGLPAGPTPRDLVWDKGLFERRLKEATAFLPPPEAAVGVKVGVFQGLGLLAHAGPGLGWTNGNVETRLPGPLAARFAADRRALSYPVSRYATPVPAFAAFRLQGDYLDRAGLTQEMGKQLTAEARRARVPVERPLRVEAPPLTLAQISLDRPAMQDCFAAMLTQVETDPDLYRVAAKGWAEGRLGAAFSTPRDPLGLCENRMYSGAFNRKLLQAETEALAARLERPGKTLAVVGIRTLLAEDGIVARLRAKGYEVKGPDGAEAR